MATHSSILAWRILWTEELSGLQSIVLQRVRHNSVSDTHTNTVPNIAPFNLLVWSPKMP